MASETLTDCPFCGKLTIKILHIPFVANTIKSKCRAGGRNTIYQKERFDVISGCDACGKSKKEVEKVLNSEEEVDHKKAVERMKKQGLPTQIEF